jgi:hypothetical protein
LKVTLDSSEPLEDALRVLGALYNVTLVRSQDGGTEPPSTEKATAVLTPEVPAKRSGSSAKATAAGAASKPRRKRASKRAASPDNAQVRSWAREQGLSVNSRGRVAASVMTAYRDAHDMS